MSHHILPELVPYVLVLLPHALGPSDDLTVADLLGDAGLAPSFGLDPVDALGIATLDETNQILVGALAVALLAAQPSSDSDKSVLYLVLAELADVAPAIVSMLCVRDSYPRLLTNADCRISSSA